MCRSYEQVAEYAMLAHPQFSGLIRAGRVNYLEMHLLRAIRLGDSYSAMALFLALVRRSPWPTLKFLLRMPLIATRGLIRGSGAAPKNEPNGRVPFYPALGQHVSSGSEVQGQAPTVPVNAP